MNFIIPQQLERGDYGVSYKVHSPQPGKYYSDKIPGWEGTLTQEALLSKKELGVGHFTTTITNYTHETIMVISSNNTFILIPPTPDEYKFDRFNDGKVIIEKSICKPDMSSTGETKFHQYRQMMLKGKDMTRDDFYKLGHSQNKEMMNEYHQFVAPSPCDHEEGGYYLKEAGLVIVSVQSNDVFLHPDLPEEEIMELLPSEELGHLNILVKINDPEHRLSRGFINVGDMVMGCPITRDGSKKAGITLMLSKRTKHIHGNGTETFYELDDPSCPIKIYTSIKEAETKGNVSAKLAYDTALLKQEVGNEKARNEIDEFILQQQKQLLEKDTLIDKLNQEKSHRDRLDKIHEKERKIEEERLRVEEEKVRLDRISKINQAKNEEAARKRQDKVSRTEYIRKILVEGAKLATAAITAVFTVVAWYKLKRV